MKEPLTISRQSPELESMDYSRLREAGIAWIQEMAGEIWTDYNTHDPGVTILEVLCYAITDLGYRAGQNIEDIIAPDPASPEAEDIKNFFTAAEILPNRPVTFDDYRKLIIDVSVYDDTDTGCESVGVRNAWISVADTPEVPFWADRARNTLSYEPPPQNPEAEPIPLRPLYDILLEFEQCETFGDLNSPLLTDSFTVTDAGVQDLEGMELHFEVEFARWDDPDVEWESPESIRKSIRDLSVQFLNTPAAYGFSYDTDEEHALTLEARGQAGPGPDLTELTAQANAFLESMAVSYQGRVQKILEIIGRVRSRLHANRNLCEDFRSFRALKIESIVVCADIELDLDADVEEVQAQIFHRITRFLSPDINFYTLTELLQSGTPVEEIFEGPLLEHGFVTDSELKQTSRREVIYVSDLIQIIMNVDGVTAVKEIEIANLPQGNEEGIPSRSVTWCLELAHRYNYVPRLSVADSKLTFFKEQLPYLAKSRIVDERLRELESEEGSRKMRDPVRDLKPPRGQFLDLGRYTSIQEEFPSTYGVGSAGLSSTVSEKRRAEAKQLKGYLKFFDQLLVNYLAQLAHVRELFSMSAERDETGRYKIGRTYYTQALSEAAPPEERELYTQIDTHIMNLNRVAESPELFVERRNKFLDHLMARFAEQFTEYATLTYRLSGEGGGEELIRDKLAFLNAYPEISSGRGTAFNYRDLCRLWHIDNRSGLEKRSSLHVGIDKGSAEDLVFTENFTVTESGGVFGFEVRGADHATLLTEPAGSPFGSRKEAAEAVEKLINSGLFREAYKVTEGDGGYQFTLYCGELPAGISKKQNYGDLSEAEADIEKLIEVMEREYFENHESNRNNYTAPVENYFSVSGSFSGSSFQIAYRLYSTPFSTDEEDLLLEGSLQGELESAHEAGRAEELEERTDEFIWDVVSSGALLDRYSFFRDEEESGRLRLTDRFGRELGVSGGDYEELSEAEGLRDFFYNTFFSREGVHLVEHILLRPLTDQITEEQHAGDVSEPDVSEPDVLPDVPEPDVSEPDVSEPDVLPEGAGTGGDPEPAKIRDPLMPIYLDPECSHCQLTDPYSYIATVVLPYWQGRFSNMDFRKYFERRIREEAPAHVFLKICWISNRQMRQFESCYKRWLLERSRTEPDRSALSAALEDLITMMDQLRNVYPVGRLHDYEESDTLEEAMILNNSILGSA